MYNLSTNTNCDSSGVFGTTTNAIQQFRAGLMGSTETIPLEDLKLCGILISKFDSDTNGLTVEANTLPPSLPTDDTVINTMGNTAARNKNFMKLLVRKSVEDITTEQIDRFRQKVKVNETIVQQLDAKRAREITTPPPSQDENSDSMIVNNGDTPRSVVTNQKVELICIPVRRPGEDNTKKLCVIDKNMSIFLHLQLLNHCTSCTGCSSQNCTKMLSYLTHRSTCTLYSQNTSCAICSRVNLMLVYHAKRCVSEACAVPHCGTIKLKLARAAEDVIAHCAAA